MLEGINLAKKLQEARKSLFSINTKIQGIDMIRKMVYHRGFNEFNTLERHTQAVNSVAFNHNGQFIASASTDTTATVWRADGTVKAVLAGHSQPIYRVAFGYHRLYQEIEELIVTASADKTAIIWKLNGDKLAILQHDSPVYRVAFSPQYDLIITATKNGTIGFWRFKNGSFKLIKKYPEDGAAVWAISFSPEGDLIATASFDHTVKLWDRDGSFLKALEGHSDKVYSVSFSPKGDLIATASADKTVKLWNRDGSFLKNLEGHSDKVYNVSFSPEGDLIATASFDHTVKLWNRDGSFLKTLEGHSDKVYSVSFSPKGDLIATASHDNTVRIWNQDGTWLDTLQGHGNIVYNAIFSPAGNLVASGGLDSKIKLWKYNSLQDTYKNYHCRRIAFNTDGRLIALVCYDQRFYILSTEDIANPIFKSEKRNGNFLSVAFSPKAELIATGNQEGMIELWKFDGDLVRSWQGHDQRIYDIDFSHDGNIIATTSNDKTIKFWDINGNLLKDRSLENIPKPQSIDFSPIEDVIAIGSAHNIIKNSRQNNTNFTETFVDHEGQILNVRFSPNGKFIVSTGWDQILKIWTNDGRLIKSIEEHSGPVTDVAFRSDGSLLASTSYDTTVKLWTLDGKFIHTLLGHDHLVESLTFSPDGNTIATISDDKTLKLWNLDLDDLLQKGCDWVSDYLKHNPNVQESKRRICNAEASSTALLLKGEKMAIDGKIEAAVVFFRQVVKRDESLGKIVAQILVASGIKFAKNNSNSEAKFCFDEALKFDPSLMPTPKIGVQKFPERNHF
ncbi:MAG: WD40 repeat domain-containing protein [Limnospira sp.]